MNGILSNAGIYRYHNVRIVNSNVPTANYLSISKLIHQLFLKINTVYIHPLLDAVYPWFREGNTWIPLYLFIIVLV